MTVRAGDVAIGALLVLGALVILAPSTARASAGAPSQPSQPSGAPQPASGQTDGWQVAGKVVEMLPGFVDSLRELFGK